MSEYTGGTTEADLNNRSAEWRKKDNHYKAARQRRSRTYVDFNNIRVDAGVGAFELFTDPDFDNTSAWEIIGPVWTVAGGQAALDTSGNAGVVSNLQEQVESVSGQTYLFTVEVLTLTNVTGNEVFAFIGSETRTITETGTQSWGMTAPADNANAGLRTSGLTDGDEVGTFGRISCLEANAPAQITQFSLTPADTQITLNWSAPSTDVAPITEYIIERSLNGVDWSQT